MGKLSCFAVSFIIGLQRVYQPARALAEGIDRRQTDLRVQHLVKEDEEESDPDAENVDETRSATEPLDDSEAA